MLLTQFYKILTVVIILIVCSRLYIYIAKKYSIVDKPNSRSSHTDLTIRGGGILFYIGLLIFCVANNFQYHFFLIGITIAAFISFIRYILYKPRRFINK